MGTFKVMSINPLNVCFGKDWAHLTWDLLFDSKGRLKFKPELLNDVQKMILPTLINKVCFYYLCEFGCNG